MAIFYEILPMLVVLVGFVALAMAATAYGVDSREPIGDDHRR